MSCMTVDARSNPALAGTNIILPIIRYIVPTIAGNIPPEVIPSVGAEVKNSQLITPTPL